jgi:hypothetical protein
VFVPCPSRSDAVDVAHFFIEGEKNRRPGGTRSKIKKLRAVGNGGDIWLILHESAKSMSIL